MVDGGWWMVDGGWWMVWMVDGVDGGWWMVGIYLFKTLASALFAIHHSPFTIHPLNSPLLAAHQQSG